MGACAEGCEEGAQTVDGFAEGDENEVGGHGGGDEEEVVPFIWRVLGFLEREGG